MDLGQRQTKTRPLRFTFQPPQAQHLGKPKINATLNEWFNRPSGPLHDEAEGKIRKSCTTPLRENGNLFRERHIYLQNRFP
jgi:hypothetical protein